MLGCCEALFAVVVDIALIVVAVIVVLDDGGGVSAVVFVLVNFLHVVVADVVLAVVWDNLL